MKKVGRPTDYKKEYNEKVYKFALLGAIDEQIADFFDVSTVTLNAWKYKYPDFLNSIKRGKLEADAQIAEALFHRGKGYSHPEEKIFQYEGLIIKTDTIKHYPPDTAAAFIWLKNRQGNTWKDRKDTTITFDNADEYFKNIAQAINKSDTNPD